MADTLSPVLVGSDQYYSVSSLTSNAIIAGDSCNLQNLGKYYVDVIVKATQPAATDKGSPLPADLRSQGNIPSGQNEIWLKASRFSCMVSIQEA